MTAVRPNLFLLFYHQGRWISSHSRCRRCLVLFIHTWAPLHTAEPRRKSSFLCCLPAETSCFFANQCVLLSFSHLTVRLQPGESLRKLGLLMVQMLLEAEEGWGLPQVKNLDGLNEGFQVWGELIGWFWWISFFMGIWQMNRPWDKCKIERGHIKQESILNFFTKLFVTRFFLLCYIWVSWIHL